MKYCVLHTLKKYIFKALFLLSIALNNYSTESSTTLKIIRKYKKEPWSVDSITQRS